LGLDIPEVTPDPDHDGFGRLWLKVYTLRFAEPDSGFNHVRAIAEWQQHISDFWPEETRLIRPGRFSRGKRLWLRMAGPMGMRIDTNLEVTDASAAAFTFSTVAGHPFAGTVRCSADVGPPSCLMRVEARFRPSDPLYELGFLLGGAAAEDAFWEQTLVNAGRHFGVGGTVTTEARCLDRRRNWRKAGNIRNNAAIRTLVHRLTSFNRAQTPSASVGRDKR
jgi:hypothetical protein